MHGKRSDRSDRRKGSEAQRVAAVDELMTAAALLYFRMRNAAQELVGEGALSSGRRSVLRSLAREGMQTVPQMARERAISRQHVQTVVNALRDDGLVELVDNPAHKRSRLVRVTAAGRRLVETMARTEAAILPALTEDIAPADIRTATEVLERLKEAFDGAEWRRLLARRGNRS